MEGYARLLRGEVEERHLDGGDRAGGQWEHPRAHLVQDRLARQRVLADENGQEVAHRLRGVAVEVEGGGVPHRSDPFSAVFGRHLHDDAGHELRRQIVRPGMPLHRRPDAPHPDPLDPTHLSSTGCLPTIPPTRPSAKPGPHETPMVRRAVSQNHPRADRTGIPPRRGSIPSRQFSSPLCNGPPLGGRKRRATCLELVLVEACRHRAGFRLAVGRSATLWAVRAIVHAA